MANEEIQSLLQSAIQAAQGGNKIIARRILEQIVELDSNNELAWIWMASVVDTSLERRQHLERVLAINPNNIRAKQALSKLQIDMQPSASTTRATPTPAIPSVPSVPRPSTTQPRETRPNRRRRRFMTPPFIIGVVLAIAMIASGLVLLWNDLQSTDETTPESSITPVANETVVSAAPSALVTLTLSNLSPLPPTQTPTPRPVETSAPTWTPIPTHLPTATPTATATPLPLTSFTLLFSGKRDEPTWKLYTLTANGSNEQELVLTFPSSVAPYVSEIFDASFSPDGEQIVFTVKLNPAEAIEFEDLFIAPATGGAARRLTTLEAAHVASATWSPDGKQIAFASDTDGDYEIFVVAPTGGAPSRLTDNTYEDRDPAWSSTGLLAFVSDEDQPGDLEIYTMDLDSATLRRLTTSANDNYAPAWSPDGASIVFLSTRHQTIDLYTMTADGSNERTLLIEDNTAEERTPAWSLDGQWIAFSSNRKSPNFDLYLVQSNGAELQRITFNSGDTHDVTWKP